MQEKIGTLYVVATPIGNLQDITLRAIEVLKVVDRMVAEDTRRTGLLLKHFSIHKPIISLHDFNERKQLKIIMNYLQQGESLALVSDAGTPLISDPGFLLVVAAKAAQIPIIPIPGACAAIVALSVSGLPADKFIFEGFLPPKKNAREQRLMALKNETRTIIFYEAPHRILEMLQSMLTVLGSARKASIARELTKIHERIYTNNLQDLLHYFSQHTSEQRGEFVVLIEGEDLEKENKMLIGEEVLRILLAELPLKQAVKLASKITGERKNVLYNIALQKPALPQPK